MIKNDTLHSALRTIDDAGGTPYFVGGTARDFLFTGEDPKDIDIEVFGLEADQLMECLAYYGQVQMVGSSYGVYTVNEVRHNNLPVEFSIPRAKETRSANERDNPLDHSHDPLRILGSPYLHHLQNLRNRTRHARSHGENRGSRRTER